MQDIANAASVSQTTVSLVLNKRNGSLISDSTRERVVATARELGYRPNQLARALAKGHTNTIGLWIRSLHSSFYMQLVHDIDDVITGSSYVTIITRNVTISDTFSFMQEFPLSSVDGIIAVDIPETVDNFVSELRSRTPIVNVGSHVTESADAVVVELVTATRTALEHMYATGRRRIAYLIDQPSYSVGGGERLLTYTSFMNEAGLPPEIILSTGQLHQEALEAVADRVAEGSFPEALLCYNDDMAIGANRALHAAGLRLPEDVALVGCDDVEEARFMEPPLNTIVHPRKQISALAWQFLQNRIANPADPHRHAVVSAQYVKRESV